MSDVGFEFHADVRNSVLTSIDDLPVVALLHLRGICREALIRIEHGESQWSDEEAKEASAFYATAIKKIRSRLAGLCKCKCDPAWPAQP